MAVGPVIYRNLAFLALMNSILTNSQYLGCYYNIGSNHQRRVTSIGECQEECTKSLNKFQYAVLFGYGFCYCANGIHNIQRDNTKCRFCQERTPPICNDPYWYSVYPAVCQPGKWGRTKKYHPSVTSCAFRCGHCRNNATCDDVTGRCPDDHCESGWKPPNCDHNIEDPRYLGCFIENSGAGLQRSITVTLNAVTVTDCVNDCVMRNYQYAGLAYGDKCYCGNNYNYYGPGTGCDVPCPGDTTQICGGEHLSSVYKAECTAGYWGRSPACRERCYCRNGDSCNIRGNCPNGCAPGWTGQHCDQKCSAGTYGNRCMYQCGNCSMQPCDHVNGSCTGGCLAGWRGPRCDQECAQGTYGDKCKKTCGHCITQPCNRADGSCTGRCEPGWQGNRCDQDTCSCARKFVKSYDKSRDVSLQCMSLSQLDSSVNECKLKACEHGGNAINHLNGICSILICDNLDTLPLSAQFGGWDIYIHKELSNGSDNTYPASECMSGGYKTITGEMEKGFPLYVIGIIIGMVVVLVLIIVAVIIIKKKRGQSNTESPQTNVYYNDNAEGSPAPTQDIYDEIAQVHAEEPYEDVDELKGPYESLDMKDVTTQEVKEYAAISH